MGKGSKRRPGSHAAYCEGWDRWHEKPKSGENEAETRVDWWAEQSDSGPTQMTVEMMEELMRNLEWPKYIGGSN